MSFALLSFVAGLLTVLAPCVLPMLPIVVGSSAVSARRYTLAVVIASLGVSIFAFTFLLKVSTAFIAIPASFWSAFSGGLILFFGITLLFPRLWGAVPFLSFISAASNRAAGSGVSQGSYTGDAILGASLGPIFSTCSPTYFVILASALPASLAVGSFYLALYVLGIALALTVVVYAGEALFARLQAVADARGWVKRAVGVVFVLLGLGIIFGLEKKVEIALLDAGYDITKVETYLSGPAAPKQEEFIEVPGLDSTEVPVTDVMMLKEVPQKRVLEEVKKAPVSSAKNMYKEFVNPAGFVFSEPFAMSDVIGKKNVLVAIFTYSCSNCQNAMPYINAINAKYAGEDFVVIGVHTPEFAYEKDIDNVRRELTRQGVTFPTVLDNDYGTWRAYDNHYWPARYLINKQGEVVFSHFGEGAYTETSREIEKLLQK